MREIDKGNGWKVREIIEPDTAKRHTQYFYKRKRAPRVELTGKIAKQLAGYTLIEKDLRNVSVWLKEIEKLYPRNDENKLVQISPNREVFNIVKGLYVAALTFYGKCFTTCEGRGIKLEKGLIDDAFLEAHEDAMHMRHNFAAHSGADSFEEVKVALILHPSRNTEHLPIIFRELTQADFKDAIDDEISFRSLVEHVRSKVIEKTRIVEDKVYEKEVFPKGRDYWYQKAKKS